MARPQPGIFAQGTRSHYHLEFDLRARRHRRRIVAPRSRGLREPPVTAGGSNIVVGFGADALAPARSPTTRPPTLAPFDADRGRRPRARRPPSTTSGCGPTAPAKTSSSTSPRAVAAALAPVATLAAEQPCFVYRDSRDLTGFIDGTENPPVEEAHDVALVPDGEPGAGGAFVIAQKWVHDLAAFHAQAVDEQEATIGRTKPDSVELDDKPDDRAHQPRRDRGRRRGARDLPAQHAVRAGRGARPLLPRLQRRPAAASTRCCAGCSAPSGDGLHDHLTDFTTPGERRVLLRAVARRARRHPARPTDGGRSQSFSAADRRSRSADEIGLDLHAVRRRAVESARLLREDAHELLVLVPLEQEAGAGDLLADVHRARSSPRR